MLKLADAPEWEASTCYKSVVVTVAPLYSLKEYTLCNQVLHHALEVCELTQQAYSLRTADLIYKLQHHALKTLVVSMHTSTSEQMPQSVYCLQQVSSSYCSTTVFYETLCNRLLRHTFGSVWTPLSEVSKTTPLGLLTSFTNYMHCITLLVSTLTSTSQQTPQSEKRLLPVQVSSS